VSPRVPSLRSLERRIVDCRECPRLVRHREAIALEKTKRFRDEDYWGRPVPSFGDRSARLLIVGLAPAAHGANRTGRMFTGDRSGEWLYLAMYRSGFASRPESVGRGDGLELHDAYVTAAAHCAPPGNKPTREELRNCRGFLEMEIRAARDLRVVIALGRVAFDAFLGAYRAVGGDVARPRPKFAHGSEHGLASGVVLLASYHPSQQNTFTGRLTRDMLQSVFARARDIIDDGRIAPRGQRRYT
jgi:uracil-DNA glycosylase family 4